ncbi:MAG: mechanosensitive ion channel [Phaeodactylibacter sp.]|nr:mechanosensitive ion channel [Phaeodactylibacter sp.]
MTIEELLSQTISIGNLEIPLAPVTRVVGAILILFLARLLIWFTNKVILARFFQRKKVDIGRQYTIRQLVLYFFYTMAVLLALESVGVKLSVLWAGSAALLVGVGLGLQQTFNDIVSGLIILGEGTVEVGDTVEVDGFVGIVQKIGLRTSTVETRNKLSIIIPNSKLVVENVTNWSHNESESRFQVAVGVSYGSDPELVKQLLLEVASQHPKILNTPAPHVEFRDFGDSSLDFILHYYSTEFYYRDTVRSDLRFAIQKIFKANGIEIPFPQRDVWLKNAAPQKEN